ncbi:putative fatty acyl-CoA reductase [Halotydeus destructor]|nr:putative fatty acyl-CoA reductase [Halotydeus destructor]
MSWNSLISKKHSWRQSFTGGAGVSQSTIRSNLPMDMQNESKIANFYVNRSVFITGATGFMGKVLVEKLLRSCPGIKNIYVLLRTKKGMEARQRLDELLNAKIFDRIREESPKTLYKVVPVPGDIALPGLGITENDQQLLCNEVSIVFHSAATVKFDEPLRTSIEFNVLGTRRVVQLCHKMPQLVALIHVSTAYANCNRDEIDEVLYPPPIAPQKAAAADLIPVDTVINLMVTTAWHTATQRPNSLMIYNCTSGQLNTITWGDIERIAFPALLRYPSSQVLRYPGGSFKNNKMVNNVSVFFEHVLPAYFFDGLCALTGRKRIMLKIMAKLQKAIKTLEWFTTRHWSFKNNNVLMLNEQLEGSDKETFAFDVRELHWPTYWEDYVLGTRKFILKEEHSTLPQARKSLQRLYYVNKLASIVLMLGVWQVFAMRTQAARRMWFFFTSVAMKLYSLLSRT